MWTKFVRARPDAGLSFQLSAVHTKATDFVGLCRAGFERISCEGAGAGHLRISEDAMRSSWSEISLSPLSLSNPVGWNLIPNLPAVEPGSTHGGSCNGFKMTTSTAGDRQKI